MYRVARLSEQRAAGQLLRPQRMSLRTASFVSLFHVHRPFLPASPRAFPLARSISLTLLVSSKGARANLPQFAERGKSPLAFSSKRNLLREKKSIKLHIVRKAGK